MISRKSAKLIADAFALHFKSPFGAGVFAVGPQVYKLQEEHAYNFLYENEYNASFIHVMRNHIYDGTTATLARAIMGIHTGEIMLNATKSLTVEARQQEAQTLLRKLAEDMFHLYESIPIRQADPSKVHSKEQLDMVTRIRDIERPAASILDNLKLSLELDGYLYRDGRLYPVESTVIDTVEEQTYLEQLIRSIRLRDPAVITHHIQGSERAFTEKQWGHSISDARNFLEAILQQIAAAHYLKTQNSEIPDSTYKSPVKVREYLHSSAFLDKNEQEATAKIYGLLSNTGSHPNIAAKCKYPSKTIH